MSKIKNEVLEFVETHNACKEGMDFALTHETLADVYDQCPRGDWLMWMLQKGGKIDKKTAVKLACEFALRVLPIYEKKYSRKEPREAIEAALAWVDDPTEEKRLVCRKAAAAAADAADAAAAAYAAYAADAAAAYAADAADAADANAAAYAADAAAYAAYDAADAYDAAAANAAAYAADAAAYAANAAAYAADAARRTARANEQQAQADLIRKTVSNPWRV